MMASACEKDATGIVTVYANLYIDTCTFSNMVSNGNGAALSIKSQSAAIIRNSTFFFNISKASGGSLYFSESMGYLQNSSFYNNWALRGHALDSNSNSFIYITNSNFVNNGYVFLYENGRLPRVCPGEDDSTKLYVFHPEHTIFGEEISPEDELKENLKHL